MNDKEIALQFNDAQNKLKLRAELLGSRAVVALHDHCQEIAAKAGIDAYVGEAAAAELAAERADALTDGVPVETFDLSGDAKRVTYIVLLCPTDMGFRLVEAADNGYVLRGCSRDRHPLVVRCRALAAKTFAEPVFLTWDNRYNQGRIDRRRYLMRTFSMLNAQWLDDANVRGGNYHPEIFDVNYHNAVGCFLEQTELTEQEIAYVKERTHYQEVTAEAQDMADSLYNELLQEMI